MTEPGAEWLTIEKAADLLQLSSARSSAGSQPMNGHRAMGHCRTAGAVAFVLRAALGPATDTPESDNASDVRAIESDESEAASDTSASDRTLGQPVLDIYGVQL
jgi:hypothetical protein